MTSYGRINRTGRRTLIAMAVIGLAALALSAFGWP
jgi:hypothetical protein